MYERIIVPIDGSEASRRVISVAVTLAERNDAPLMLVTVHDAPGQEDDLREIAATIHGHKVETTVLFDENPAMRLASMVGSEPRGLVCMSTHGRGGLRQAVLGSVAERVVRDGGVPVVLVGPRYDDSRTFSLDRLLVCVDGSTLSEGVIPTALAWSREFHSSLLLAQVVSPMAEAPTAARRIPEGASGPHSYLARLAASLAGRAPIEWAVTADERPQRGILDLADKHGVSLIAMATHGESGVARFALGSVATAVTCTSALPVLVVRPPMSPRP